MKTTKAARNAAGEEQALKRRIIQIDEEKCNGCGACANACHEGAIAMVDGKARLMRDDYCDGLGDCLPACPTGAISFVEREAAPYDKAAAEANVAAKRAAEGKLPCGWLLVAADCTAFARADFHERFIKGRVTLVGCPKLDGVDYAEKLTEIIRNNDIKDVTVVRMEVPCCGGIEDAVKRALMASGKFLPWQVVTVAVDGEILD